MRKTITEQDEYTGRIVTGKMPRRAKQGDFDIARTDTVGRRIARKLWH